MIKQEGLPEEGELVLCTVKNLLPHCAFVTIDEYEGLEGMLHVSEVSLRGVRNIKDHLSVGKTMVCKVLRVNNKGEIDVSLKRVKGIEMKRKMNEVRTNKRVYKLIEHAAKKAGAKAEINKLISQAREKYNNLSHIYDEVRDRGVEVLNSLKASPKLMSALKQEFEELLWQLKVNVKKRLRITCNEGDGVERIKNLLKKVNEEADYKASIQYLGSPNYVLKITARNYKIAEKSRDKVIDKLMSEAGKLGVMVSALEK